MYKISSIYKFLIFCHDFQNKSINKFKHIYIFLFKIARLSLAYKMDPSTAMRCSELALPKDLTLMHTKPDFMVQRLGKLGKFLLQNQVENESPVHEFC